MIDLQSIGTLITSIKTTGEMVSAMKGVHDAALFDARVIELRNQILNVQEAALKTQAALQELLDQNRELRSIVEQADEWKEIAKRYQLKNYGGETFAQELRQDMAAGEPIHRLCPTCFDAKRRSILQSKGQRNYRKQQEYHCPSCKCDMAFGEAYEPTLASSSVIRRGSWMSD